MVTVRHSEGLPLRRSCPPFRLADANRLVKPFPRIPRVRVRVRVRVRLDQPAIQVSSRSFGMADLRSGGPKSLGLGLGLGYTNLQTKFRLDPSEWRTFGVADPNHVKMAKNCIKALLEIKRQNY